MSSRADLNLLFGIMAVQNDFVSRDALIEAMNAWVLDKAKALGDILVERGALSPERHALLTALVAEHIKAHHNDPQQSLAAVSSDSPLRRQLSQIGRIDHNAKSQFVSLDRDSVFSFDPSMKWRTGSLSSFDSSVFRFFFRHLAYLQWRRAVRLKSREYVFLFRRLRGTTGMPGRRLGRKLFSSCLLATPRQAFQEFQHG
jgi:hypothetical protein